MRMKLSQESLPFITLCAYDTKPESPTQDPNTLHNPCPEFILILQQPQGPAIISSGVSVEHGSLRLEVEAIHPASQATHLRSASPLGT